MLAPVIITQIYGEFLTLTRLRLQTLPEIFDRQQVGELAHTIKGTAGMLGAQQIAACAEQLESDLDSHRAFESTVQRLGKACLELETELRKEQVLR